MITTTTTTLRETQPLRRLSSCSYKRSSVERFFRQAGFAVDWCAFRLLHPQQQEKEAGRRQEQEGGRRREFTFTARGPAGRSWRVESLLTWALLPTLLFLLFSAALGGLLWADCGQVSDIVVIVSVIIIITIIILIILGKGKQKNRQNILFCE